MAIQWKTPLFLWPFSIVMENIVENVPYSYYQRVSTKIHWFHRCGPTLTVGRGPGGHWQWRVQNAVDAEKKLMRSR